MISGFKSTPVIPSDKWAIGVDGGQVIRKTPYGLVHSGNFFTEPVRVPVFADASERNGHWTDPEAGWMCWLTDPGALTIWDGDGWNNLVPDSEDTGTGT